MKLKLDVAKFAAITLIINAFTGVSQPSKAQEIPGRYACETSNGSPATIYYPPSGNPLVFISWVSDYFSVAGWSPERRCQQVSSKLETNRKRNQLSYMVPGISKGLPVLCASSNQSSGIIACPDERVLLTLKSARDYQVAVNQIEAINTERSNDPLRQATALERRSDGFKVINLDKMIINLYPQQDSSATPYSYPSYSTEVPCKKGRLGTCSKLDISNE